jgi:uncharacterized membrane protein YhaH (DUF805 family)
MFCTQCGKENKENSHYCGACGAGLSLGIAEPIARESEREGDPGQTKKNAMDWYFDVLKKYATFSGRARRKEYWTFTLVYFIILLTLAVIAPESVFLTLYVLAMILPIWAAAVRRLHDTNRSGLWVFISVVPFVGPFVLLWFMATAGDPSENKYGPNPKAAVAAMEEQSS